MPFGQAIIRRSAIWLFGKEVKFRFKSDEKINEVLQRFWRLNKMPTRLVPMATKGGIEGSISVKFTYDPKQKDCPLRFQILSNVDQVKYYYAVHDCEQVELVRIQYPYQQTDGHWYWYREEWTKDKYIQYLPQPIVNYAVDTKNPYQYIGSPVYPDIDLTADWVIASISSNPYGLIPIVNIKNQNNGTEFGNGDLFGLWRTVDRINLTYHLMDQANQLQINPKIALIDLEPADNDDNFSPTEAETFQSVLDDSGVPRQGKIQTIQSDGKMFEALNIYANELKQQLFDATGAVFPRQEHITNKGSLTQSVMIQMYSPLIEVIGEKRKNYGENGICLLWSTVALALKNRGIEPFTNLKSDSLADEDIQVDVTWFNQFMQSEDEKFRAFDRLNREVEAGFISPEHAVRRINEMEEIAITEAEERERVSDVEERLESLEHQSALVNDKGNNPVDEKDGKSRQQTVGPSAVKDAN
jgi:hypothetical protein